MIEPSTLTSRLGRFLVAQRWFAGTDQPRRIEVLHQERITPGWPALVEALVDADGTTYQLTVGLRSPSDNPDFLRGRDEAVIGEVDTDDGPALAYEAVLDGELCLALMEFLSAGQESARRVRPLGVEQSNTSLVYDERLILKIYRRIHQGRSRDIDMTRALVEEGFANVAPVVASRSLRDGDLDCDLAIVQPYLLGASEGWALAQTSLRDLFGMSDTLNLPAVGDGEEPVPPLDPSSAGGDFSAEARRLGEITAEMHLALSRALGTAPDPADRWAEAIAAQLERVDHPAVDAAAAAGLLGRLRDLGELGPAIHTHGDLHLAQVLRTDAGWYVIDFEGEPSRPVEERWLRSPGLRDVAGMMRSFHYAAQVALLGQGEDAEAELAEVADSWERRNRHAYFDGYVNRATGTGLVPEDPAAMATVLASFELEKAVYELAYEVEHRPDWVSIPLAALERLGIARR